MESWFSKSPKPGNVQLLPGADRPSTERNYTSQSGQLDDILKSPSESRSSLSRYLSPHDVVLAQMRGLSTPTGGVYTKDHSESLHVDHSQTVESTDVPNPSDVSGNNTAVPKEILHDPFDGSPLGLLASQGQQMQQQHAVPEGAHKEELWIHLSRVLELQNEVAKMHLEMENVGPNDGKSKAAGRGHVRTKVNAEAGGGGSSDYFAEGMDKGIGVEDAPEGDDEGVEVAGDEEAESKKAREAQFAGLADHFKGRNESINSIMGRLDLLSMALTEFHALQAPTIEFPRGSSRQYTTTTPGTSPSSIHNTPSSVVSPPLSNAGTSSLPNSNLLQPSKPSSGGSRPATPQQLLPSSRDRIIPVSLSRAALRPVDKGSNHTAPLVVAVSGIEPGKQTHMMDSPVSIAD